MGEVYHVVLGQEKGDPAIFSPLFGENPQDDCYLMLSPKCGIRPKIVTLREVAGSFKGGGRSCYLFFVF